MRRWSTQSVLAKLTIEQEKDIIDEKIAEQNAKAKMSRKRDERRDKYLDYLKNRKSQFTKIMETLKKKEMPQASVEFRPLIHPEKL